MHLIQLLLPLYSNQGERFPKTLFAKVRSELVAQFGGLTAFVNVPAEGLWQEEEGSTVRDEMVIFEVMVPRLDKAWWQQYRAGLESRFRQDVIVVRALAIEML